jgi:hypothetical protein
MLILLKGCVLGAYSGFSALAQIKDPSAAADRQDARLNLPRASVKESPNGRFGRL